MAATQHGNQPTRHESTRLTNCSGSVLHQVAAGAAAGLAADVMMHPADTIRTHVQTGHRIPWSIPKLYRGFAVVASFSAPSHAVFFATYDRVRSTSPALAGLAAELCGALIFTPQEVVKKRMQLAQHGYQSSMQDVLAAVQVEMKRAPYKTVRDLYTGYWLSVCTYGPFSALYFHFYESLRRDKHLSPWLAASIGGGVAAVVTTPFDVALTRLQTRHGNAASLYAVLRGMFAERAWFQGALARAAWLAPCAGISLQTFETLLEWLGNDASRQ